MNILESKKAILPHYLVTVATWMTQAPATTTTTCSQSYRVGNQVVKSESSEGLTSLCQESKHHRISDFNVFLSCAVPLCHAATQTPPECMDGLPLTTSAAADDSASMLVLPFSPLALSPKATPYYCQKTHKTVHTTLHVPSLAPPWPPSMTSISIGKILCN